MNTSHSHNSKDQSDEEEKSTFIIESKLQAWEGKHGAGTTPFSCEEVTYIDSQGDILVTLTFGFSHTQNVLSNFFSLFK